MYKIIRDTIIMEREFIESFISIYESTYYYFDENYHKNKERKIII